MRRFITLVLFLGVSVANVQEPFSAQFHHQDDFEFRWPIQRVAIIGAGPSGISSYHELTEAGLEVRIFERDSVPGGVWHYTEEVPLGAPVPNAASPIGDFVPSLPPAGVNLPYSEELEDDGDMIAHRLPRPLWESLKTNVPSPLQRFLQWPWPPGTPWELSHYQVRNYIRSYASYLFMNSNDENPATVYNTRVEHIEKRINEAGQEQGWRLWLKKLEPTLGNTYRATWWIEDFDAVIVASGKYNSPSMPSIPGLDNWVQRFPDLVHHSRQYRRPEKYANQTVLIVGASVSGSEISRDLNHRARKIYQSYRHSNDSRVHYRANNFLRRIPRNTTLVGEIKQFLPVAEGSPISSGLVELKNGTILSGIDSIILATGYRYCYPFLSQYYDDATYTPHEGSAPTVSPFLPLDGSHIRDLYLDMFYIPDPTLAFVGAVQAPPSYLYSDYATLALAKVWTNTAKLPSAPIMRALHAKTVAERGGYGKHVLFLGPTRSPAAVAYFVGWLNSEAAKYGGKQVDGFPMYSKEVAYYWQTAHFGAPLQDSSSKEDETVLVSLGYTLNSDEDVSKDIPLAVYDDDW